MTDEDPCRVEISSQAHYVPHEAHDVGDVCWAAMVTALDGDEANLTVFPPDALPGYVRGPVARDQHGKEPHTWHWPGDHQGPLDD